MTRTVGLIAAVSPDGVIAVDGRTPWHYPADRARFVRLTRGTTVIMGRGTFEEIGEKPLPHRTCFVVTRKRYDGVRTFASVEDALAAAEGDVWVIGGARVYEAALPFAERVDLTYVPDRPEGDHTTSFPALDPSVWTASPRLPLDDDPRLEVQTFLREAPRS